MINKGKKWFPEKKTLKKIACPFSDCCRDTSKLTDSLEPIHFTNQQQDLPGKSGSYLFLPSFYQGQMTFEMLDFSHENIFFFLPETTPPMVPFLLLLLGTHNCADPNQECLRLLDLFLAHFTQFFFFFNFELYLKFEDSKWQSIKLF